MPSAVPAEDELVAVDVDVLLPKAMVGAHSPTLEVGEDAMHPLQHDVGGQCILGAQVMGLVPARRRPLVSFLLPPLKTIIRAIPMPSVLSSPSRRRLDAATPD